MKALLVCLFLIAFSYYPSFGQQYKISFNDNNSGNRKIKIFTRNSNITVKGYDGNAVSIERKGLENTKSKDEKTLGLDVKNENNVITIKKISDDEDSYLIRVPKLVAVVVEEELRTAKTIEISGIDGLIEVRSWLSKIDLEHVTGPISIESQAGDVSVTFDKIDQKSPSTITSAGRKVDVTMPADAKTDLNLKVMTGNLSSDFALQSDKAQKEEEGEVREVVSQLNGGGVDLNIIAHSISLKKSKSN